ncbi:MAG: SGNH/GDSL hydrolase family protein, partial [Planctomycetota bacterium]
NKVPDYLIRDHLIAETTDLPSLHALYNDAMRFVAGEMGVALADCAHALTPGADRLMMRDGIHPNDEGHREIAQVLLDTIRRAYPEY